MKILFIGDIVGEPGREILCRVLPEIVKAESADFIIANAENAAGGKGLVQKVSDELFSCGVNVITMGNHTFDRNDIEMIIDDKRILRPANYPQGVPGNGWGIYENKGRKVAVASFMGRVYMPLLDCPFQMSQKVIEILKQHTNIIFIDFHTEITSEKQAFGWFLNGKVSAVLGTHTHVQTADERILPQGTAYITDCGMTGPRDGVIGMDREIILKRYLTGLPQRFEVAKGERMLNACVVEIDDQTGKATGIKRIVRYQ